MRYYRNVLLFAIMSIALLLLLISCSDDESPVSPDYDHRPPNVEWIAPASGAELSGEVEISFNAIDDNGLDSVKLYVNGTLFSLWKSHFNPSLDTDTTFTFSWNTLDYEDGVYILEARAWDESGNLGISPSLVVEVKNDNDTPEDRLAPYVWWMAPDAGSTLSDTVDLQVGFYDENEVDSVKVYVNGGQRVVIPVQTGMQTGMVEYLWDTHQDSDGVYILEARAWDTSGNLGTSPSLMVRVQNEGEPPPEDRVAPYVWWITPDAGSTLSDTVDLQVGFYDENEVDSIKVYINGGQRVVIPLQTGIQTGMVEYLWDTRTDSDGVHLWEARGWDSAGNQGASTALLVRVANDTTSTPPEEDYYPPVVNWLSPEAGSEVSGTVHLRFQVMDGSTLDSVIVYLGGRKLQKLEGLGSFLDGDVEWLTSDYADGNYTVEVRAWDASGNMGIGIGVSLTVRNNVPRVIWVPDDYETIQGAINASRDGDTVRVRAGTYYEGLRLMGKNIWLESESGPEVTIVDASVEAFGLRIDAGQDSNTVIRGLTFANANYDGISITDNSFPNLYNCIIRNSSRYNYALWETSICRVMNNVFDESGSANVNFHTAFSVFENNVVINSERTALWNLSPYFNPLVVDFNLFWNYGNLTNDPSFEFGQYNIIDREPLFQEGSYRLREDSPCINSGDPSILDIDGSISDIGVYGGPFGYPTQ